MRHAVLACGVAFAGFCVPSISHTAGEGRLLDTGPVRLTITFSGDNSAKNLAWAYEILATRYPKLIAPPPASEQQSSDVPVCDNHLDPIKVAVCAKRWPASAYLDEEFDAFLRERVARNRPSVEWLPYATVETSIAIGRFDAGAVGVTSEQDLTDDRKQTICKKRNWPRVVASIDDPKRAPVDCVVGLRRNVSLDRSGNQIPAPPSLLVRRPAYVLTLLRPAALAVAVHASEDVVKEIVGRDVSARGHVIPTFQGVGSGRTNHKTSAAEPCSKAFLEGHKTQVAWPSVAVPENQWRRLIVFDPTVPRLMSSDNEDFTDEFRHPLLNGSGSGFATDCAALGQATQATPAEVHALSVASVVYSKSAQINTGVSSLPPFNVSAFLPPSWVMFADNKRLPSTELLVDELDSPRTLLASYEEFPDRKGKVLVDIPRQTLEGYLGRVLDFAVENSVLVVAAPRKATAESDFPMLAGPEVNERMPSWDVCRDWPACVGWTPVALVVAPLSRNGDLLEPDRYKLGAAVIGVTAPGERIPVAVHTSAGLAFRTGSSVAVGAVGAVALLLQSDAYGAHTPVQLIARIAAASDIYSSEERDSAGRSLHSLVRYGRLNANRALTGTIHLSAVIWKRGAPVVSDSKPLETQLEVEAPRRLNSQAYTCGPERQSRGYLRLFEPGQAYYRGNAKQAECRSVSSILRLFRSGQTSEGIPTFTLVYYDTFKGGRVQRRAVVRRNVMLKSSEPDSPTVCRWDGTEAPGVPSCLYYRVAGKRPFRPLDLLEKDAVFSAKNQMIPRSSDAEGWSEHEALVWGKKRK